MASSSDIIDRAVEENSDSLKELSGKIWEKPELAYEETFAHDTLTDYLEQHGFQVDRKFKLDTAFRAVYKQGSGGPNIGYICEYDALPGIGHACGHNLIAESGVAAAMGLRAALQANPSTSATITLMGTPAEECGGGKINLIDAHAFDGIDVCLMAHPFSKNMMDSPKLACNHGSVTFTGRAAHAAAAPWEGVNALDAVVSAYNALSMLRQQIKPDHRLHAVITEGGTRPNIIPERAVMPFYIRAPTDKELGVLKSKVTDIMKAAALATGCSVNVEYSVEDRPAHYSNVITNKRLIESYTGHWKSFKPACPTISPDVGGGSTDMGNVSYVVPSIHPEFDVGCEAMIHTRDFTAFANTPEAHAATRCVAKAMSATGWDVVADSSLLAAVKEGFQKQLASIS